MKIVYNELVKNLDDIAVKFLHSANMPDFKEKKAMDEFADNCIYVVENLNFIPEEFGTFVPKIDEEEVAR
jgi:hypothetical protein